MELVQNLKAKVKPLGKKIVLPEYKDARVLEATELILKEGFATPVLVGNPEEVKALAQKEGFNVDGAEIINPETYDRLPEMIDIFVEKRAKKGMTPEKAKATMLGDCLFFGAMLVHLGVVDGMVAGSASPTANVLRAALQVVGTKPGLKTVSSSMFVFSDKKHMATTVCSYSPIAALSLTQLPNNWLTSLCLPLKKLAKLAIWLTLAYPSYLSPLKVLRPLLK